MFDIEDFKNIAKRNLDENSVENSETECSPEVSFQPMLKDGRVTAVAMVVSCTCGENYIENVFTDGSDEELELMLIDLGYRDFEDE